MIVCRNCGYETGVFFPYKRLFCSEACWREYKWRFKKRVIHIDPGIGESQIGMMTVDQNTDWRVKVVLQPHHVMPVMNLALNMMIWRFGFVFAIEESWEDDQIRRVEQIVNLYKMGYYEGICGSCKGTGQAPHYPLTPPKRKLIPGPDYTMGPCSVCKGSGWVPLNSDTKGIKDG